MTAVWVQPLGTVGQDISTAVQLGVERTFKLPVRWMDQQDLPAYAYDRSRLQYSSELILRRLVTCVPQGAVRFMAVTEVDLFIPMLTFVFGQAQLNGTACVVSTARMDQRFYGLTDDRALLLGRIQREAVHELAHTFGLTHCPQPSCPMSIATSVTQLDAKGEALCSACRAGLRKAVAASANVEFEQL